MLLDFEDPKTLEIMPAILSVSMVKNLMLLFDSDTNKNNPDR